MKINNKKLYSLVVIGFISVLSTFNQFKPTEASLTAPTSYDYGYIWNSSGSHQYYVSANGASPTSIALFTRTADGVYYNYSHTFSNSGSHSNTSNYNLPQGLDITMTFNRSNTSWTDASPTYTGYYPTENKIGSDNTVGTPTFKIKLQFNNQTNKNYRLFFDQSSTGGAAYYYYDLDTLRYGGQGNSILLAATTQLNTFFIPSYSLVEISNEAAINQRYFDAWYLKDLGVSESYTQGYDAGYEQGDIDGYADGLGNNPNILLNGFQAMVGILVNFFLMIVNLEVFGVSISSVFAILAIFVGIIWILKIVRG